MAGQQSDWWVYSTALCPPVIEVVDRNTGRLGTIEAYSEREWTTAFFAPSDPYRWQEPARVTVSDVYEELPAGWPETGWPEEDEL